ncbi:hypothetical protein [Actinomyces oris]|uniref:hypothetical protein n=1 Tax=Actinomyces oris TaxID=544580 RepID=UPI000A622780|nr:hypothetical protein [Actinomyces oris]
MGSAQSRVAAKREDFTASGLSSWGVLASVPEYCAGYRLTGSVSGAQQCGESDDAEDDEPRRGQGRGEQVVHKRGALGRQSDPVKQPQGRGSGAKRQDRDRGPPRPVSFGTPGTTTLPTITGRECRGEASAGGADPEGESVRAP